MRYTPNHPSGMTGEEEGRSIDRGCDGSEHACGSTQRQGVSSHHTSVTGLYSLNHACTRHSVCITRQRTVWTLSTCIARGIATQTLTTLYIRYRVGTSAYRSNHPTTHPAVRSCTPLNNTTLLSTQLPAAGSAGMPRRQLQYRAHPTRRCRRDTTYTSGP